MEVERTESGVYAVTPHVPDNLELDELDAVKRTDYRSRTPLPLRAND